MNRYIFFIYIGFKIMFLDCVIGRRGITIQLPPSSLAKNIILKPIFAACVILVALSGCFAQIDTAPMLPSGKKAVPQFTFNNLSPPYKYYQYLLDSKDYDFQFEATTFSLINAWWLAEISTLAYAEEEFVRPRLKRAGLPEVEFFDKLSTQCYVASNDNFAIVVFRGSEIWRKREKFDLNKVIADLRTDVDIRLSDWPLGGKVHRGFLEALYEVWPELLPYVSRLESKGCKIWVAGHSLGGALATLFGGLYGNVQGVYTYGSPRVGNADFKARLNTRIFRIVNSKDIVARLPSLGIFVHVGELKFIDSSGNLRDTITENERSDNQHRPETDDQGNSAQPGEEFSRGTVPALVEDHVPLLYAVHLWNNLIKSQRQGHFFQSAIRRIWPPDPD